LKELGVKPPFVSRSVKKLVQTELVTIEVDTKDTRIKYALRMPPAVFAEKYRVGVLLKDLEKVS